MHRPLFALLLLGALSAMPAWAQSGAAAEAPAGLADGAVSWNALSTEQKAALKPLSSLWATLNGEQQRKWMALAQNFNRMSANERATLQSRMTEWARLSPAERTQARLNFGEVRRVPADEKRAKWEEYQALPAEERERLAKDRPKPRVSAAPALRPTPADKVLRQPVTAGTPAGSGAPLKSTVPVDRNTLLPSPPAAAASAAR